jgi:hypothetical protein
VLSLSKVITLSDFNISLLLYLVRVDGEWGHRVDRDNGWAGVSVDQVVAVPLPENFRMQINEYK